MTIGIMLSSSATPPKILFFVESVYIRRVVNASIIRQRVSWGERCTYSPAGPIIFRMPRTLMSQPNEAQLPISPRSESTCDQGLRTIVYLCVRRVHFYLCIKSRKLTLTVPDIGRMIPRFRMKNSRMMYLFHM